MEKVKLSHKQDKDIRATWGWFMREEYNVLQGQLLTTMDSTVESDRQVEGMKSRIKDIQGHLWDEIHRQKQSILGSIFFTDATKPIKGNASEIEKAMEKFIKHINSMIMDEFSGFLSRLNNLIGMVFFNSKLKCVREEVGKIVRSSRFKLQNRIARGLRDKFLTSRLKTEATD